MSRKCCNSPCGNSPSWNNCTISAPPNGTPLATVCDQVIPTGLVVRADINKNLVAALASDIPNLGVGNRLTFDKNRGAFRAGGTSIDVWDNADVGDFSAAVGYNNLASGDLSFAEGDTNIAIGFAAHVEGSGNFASGFAAHAEGTANIVSGDSAHVEGSENNSLGTAAHAEGLRTVAADIASHAEGILTFATQPASHTEGILTFGLAPITHSEGLLTFATEPASHTEGIFTATAAPISHAEGLFTQTNDIGVHIMGAFGSSRADPFSWQLAGGTTPSSTPGDGISAIIRTTIFGTPQPSGEMITNVFTTGNADYAEYFEWVDGNPNNDDRVGYFVELVNDKIQCYRDNITYGMYQRRCC